MDRTLAPGLQVVTPGGSGTVIYVRMAAPDFHQAEVVSVLLDAKRGRFGYRGTIYPAGDVRPLVN